jgi:hypothetical protein
MAHTVPRPFTAAGGANINVAVCPEAESSVARML